ncbi:MAG: class I SAM-dependent methyltransferase [Candidatus Thorarchaeota archaeon]|jgi:ubiquinone/menaquinone biosynthesis C-methylase UbiE
MGEEDQFKDVHIAGQQEITLTNIPGESYLLDIGGGGEGVIGQLEGTRVVAIDKRKDELEEASVGDYLRIVMDATELGFLDSSFSTATAFFSMMYMDDETKAKVFSEVYRVLKTGSDFYLWDLKVPKQPEGSKPIYAIGLMIHLPNTDIQTGYGCPWAQREQDIGIFQKLGNDAGFKIEEEYVDDNIFFLRFRKS